MPLSFLCLTSTSPSPELGNSTSVPTSTHTDARTNLRSNHGQRPAREPHWRERGQGRDLRPQGHTGCWPPPLRSSELRKHCLLRDTRPALEKRCVCLISTTNNTAEKAKMSHHGLQVRKEASANTAVAARSQQASRAIETLPSQGQNVLDVALVPRKGLEPQHKGTVCTPSVYTIFRTGAGVGGVGVVWTTLCPHTHCLSPGATWVSS